MVSGVLIRGNRRGKVRLGCIIWLLIALAVGYTGSQYGRIYWRWYALKQSVEELAGFAGQIEDSSIRRRVLDRVVELDLPPEARRIRVWRVSNPRGLRIAMAWADSVDLLVTKREVRLSIEVRRIF